MRAKAAPLAVPAETECGSSNAAPLEGSSMWSTFHRVTAQTEMTIREFLSRNWDGLT